MIPYVRTGGTPYAIGHDTGRQLRELLHEAAAAYRANFVARYGWERVRALANYTWERVARQYHGLYQRMLGG